jgi:hypothetical protein
MTLGGSISTFAFITVQSASKVFHFIVVFLGPNRVGGRRRRTQRGGFSRWRNSSRRRTISIMITSSVRVGSAASTGASSGTDHRCCLSLELNYEPQESCILLCATIFPLQAALLASVVVGIVVRKRTMQWWCWWLYLSDLISLVPFSALFCTFSSTFQSCSVNILLKARTSVHPNYSLAWDHANYDLSVSMIFSLYATFTFTLSFS